MAAEAGAASHDTAESTEEEYRKAEEVVNRLQARIVKAAEAGRHNKVKILQRMLAHSHSARLLAVHRVTHNQGSKTPGVDGAT
jgi:RNA-directed DNA polymerase